MNRQLFVVGSARPGTFSSINAAIAQAKSGATISLPPGRYVENVVVDKMVTLIAEEGLGTVEIYARTGSVMVFDTEAAQLNGLVLTCDDDKLAAVDIPRGEVAMDTCRIEGASWAALLARDRGALVLRKCEITNSGGAGIVVTSPETSTVEDTEVTELASSGVVVAETGALIMRRCTVNRANGNGICVNGESRAVLDECTIVGAGKPAMVIEQQGGATITGLTVRESASLDLYVMSRGPLSISDSTFTGAQVQAAHIAGGSTPTLRGCTFSGAGRNAVQVTGKSAPKFENCVIEESPVAIAVDDGSSPKFSGLRLGSTSGPTIVLKGRSELTLTDATIEIGNAVALDVSESSQVTVIDVRISSSGETSVLLTDGAQATFVSALVRGGGLWVGADVELSIQDSEIVESGADGIQVVSGGSLSANRCRVRGAGRNGIALEQGARASLTECDVTGSIGDGLLLDTGEPVLVNHCVVKENRGKAVNRPLEHDRVSIDNLMTDESAAVTEVEGPLADLEHPDANIDPAGALKMSRGWRRLSGLAGLADVRVAAGTNLMRLCDLKKRRKPWGRQASVVLGGVPGSGRSEVARLYTQCLSELDLVSSGHIVRVSLARDLRPQWPGQAKVLVRKVFEDAEGGVLVVDADGEWPADSADSRTEIADALAHEMRRHAADLVVIMLGAQTTSVPLFELAPALGESFGEGWDIDEYSVADLAEIAVRRLERRGHMVPDDVRTVVAEQLSESDERTVWSAHRLADRLALTASSRTLTSADLRGMENPQVNPWDTRTT